VKFRLPGYLQPFAEGKATVEIDGSAITVGAALEALFACYPGVRDRVMTERGEVRQHVNVFVGDESIRYTGGLATPIDDAAEVTILPAVSGGA
jgi:sulfur-carrier protein